MGAFLGGQTGDMRVRLVRFLGILTSQLKIGRTLFLICVYSGISAVSLWFAYLLRFDFVIPEAYQAQYLVSLPVVLSLKLLMLFLMGQFGILLSYFRLPDLYRIALALMVASVVLVQAWYLVETVTLPPRSVILADFIFSLFLITGFRMSLRVYRERYQKERDQLRKQKRVAVIGAGMTGSNLAYNLMSRASSGLRPVVFLDDDKAKWNHKVHGIPIIGSATDLETAKENFGIEGVIISMSSATAKRILEITEQANALGLTTDIVPSMAELASGTFRASRIRPVEIEDLLGREPVDLNTDKIRSMIQGKVVMVTGAGGSIGSELCRQIFSHNPSRLLMIERCEVQLYNIEMEVRQGGLSNGNLLGLIADVCDSERMDEILSRYSPDIIFHAAAHKHVPIMEHQPSEAIKNNTFGTMQLAKQASEHKVGRFVLVSTDKAINPTNVMGASKRLAEIFIQSMNQENSGSTRFMAVRFGNVLGSSGSVVPLFRKQISEGGPVTVTHPEVIRYFMTIPEASGLVLQCATLGAGGEIYVLDMGKPIKIVDLARRMIQLSGYEPERDIEISYIGLRPGEKLFEELQHVGEEYSPTSHSRILQFTGEPYPMADVEMFLGDLETRMSRMDIDKLKQEIQGFVPEYSPFLS